MPLLKKIGQMRKEGLQDEEISQRLREEGRSSRQIDEAIDQSRVKSAVEFPPQENSQIQELQPSAMQPQSYPETMQEQYPENQENYPEVELEPSIVRGVSQEPYPEKNYQQPQYQQYRGYEEYQDSNINTDIIIETAEQIIDEKTKDLQKQMIEFLRFKTEMQGRVDHINERLRRMETIIDRLQLSILQKVGDYGKNIDNLKKEMHATQDSFSKVLRPLSDNIEELRKITGEHSIKSPKSKKPGRTTSKENTEKTKSKDGFESYIRE